MRLDRYLVEFSKEKYGKGITFIDIDETVFRTFAKILVKKDGKTVRELDNMEFNSYVLKDDESYDFQQFRNAELFRKTSIPIPQTVNRIKRMLASIKAQDNGSKIVFLTARSDFDDKKTFLKTFKDHGIDMSRPDVFVERAGNLDVGTVDAAKKQIMLRYIKTGEFRRVRLLDDHKPNLRALKDIEKNLPKDIEQKVIDKYNLDMEEEKLPAISFYALYAKPDGSLQLI